MGCTPGKHAKDVPVGKLENLGKIMKDFPLRVPCLPGNVLVSGDLPQEVVKDLAGHCKGWLYVNPESDPHFMGESIRAKGAQLQVVPFKPSKDIAATVLEQLLQSIEELPRPLMIQCTSANRAAIILLLWMAKRTGYTQGSADLLVKDLALDTVKAEAQTWLEGRLPSLEQRVAEAPELVPGCSEVRQLYDEVTSTFTYLLTCPETKEAVLVDPVLEHAERDLKVIKDLGLSLKYVLNTHCHADHITSGSKIRERLPQVQTLISAASGAKADRLLQHGEEVTFGHLRLEALATPGHTDGCMTFILKLKEKGFAFTGDTLLIRGCGRTDFQQGDARRLYRNVHEQIFTLPGETFVCPGHDYKGRGVSTVEEERRFNPRLTKSEDEFAQIMENLKLPYPKKIDTAVPSNLMCGVQDDPYDPLPI